ncbi:MAG: VOC family protein, partial [Actinomycetota bacterium]
MSTTPPALTLSHTTIAVDDLEAMLDFYCGVLGFHVTNRGSVGPDGEMAFISQDPTEHHQIVFVSGSPTGEHQFVMADHLAFRTATLDDLRTIGRRLDDARSDDLCLLISFDVDDFKRVNDSIGHAQGDALLRGI